MSCRQCAGLERVFGQRAARNDLRRYRRGGPRRTTVMLIRALVDEGVDGAEVIDIGGGVGAIALALLEAGAVAARLVDASRAYLIVAEEEAERQGLRERMSFRFGDFTELAEDESPAEVVTLDRVICCYHDVAALIDSSASRATKLYGLVYPRDNLVTRLGSRLANALIALTGTGYRAFVHREAEVERLVAGTGLVRVFHSRLGIWQVAVYRRES
ncbi:MAG TPA: methyltransferase domain-containing protein [Trueperaceae bacterium]